MTRRKIVRALAKVARYRRLHGSVGLRKPKCVSFAGSWTRYRGDQ